VSRNGKETGNEGEAVNLVESTKLSDPLKGEEPG
jgi:hypothetical protein